MTEYKSPALCNRRVLFHNWIEEYGEVLDKMYGSLLYECDEMNRKKLSNGGILDKEEQYRMKFYSFIYHLSSKTKYKK